METETIKTILLAVAAIIIFLESMYLTVVLNNRDIIAKELYT